MKLLVTTLSALAMAATLTLAEDQPPQPPQKGHEGGGKHERPNPEEIFKKLDTNNDGFLSLDEFKASPRAQHDDPAHVEEVFKKMDTNGDGKLTLEEFKAGHPHHHDGPGGPDGQGGPGGHHRKPGGGNDAPR
jgi:hypothetical protein